MKSELIKWRIQVREGTAEGEGFGRGNVRVVKHERKVKAA